ncbi:MAG: thymidylate kinase [Candidatus Nanosalina sp. J07AB43]|nr:MAG: thymidylate kinase [Candidatus Nanosalina sp. J07AB43]
MALVLLNVMFVTIEGLDGSGKTTVVDAITDEHEDSSCH